jgi:hypothetical protein
MRRARRLGGNSDFDNNNKNQFETNCKYCHLLPHFFPAGLFPMLQRFGMVMAIPGLIPACFARGDSNTAQRHFGAVLIKEPTLEQQVGGTAALTLPAALKHGLKLAAADLIGVFPHSPAALTSHMKTFEATKQAKITTTQALMLLLIVSILEEGNFTLIATYITEYVAHIYRHYKFLIF